MDSKKIFLGREENYAAARPSYSNKLIAKIFEICNITCDSRIADIGAGTGKFTKQLLERGVYVTCVEPNVAMMDKAKIALSNYDRCNFVFGDSSNTNLPSKSVQFVTVAQAFHWFDVEKFKKECGRILTSDGKVVLVWNLRDKACKINAELEDICKKYCPHFKGFSGGIENAQEKIASFFDDSYEKLQFENPLEFDLDKFISRSLSSSYSLQKGEENFDEYIAELKQLFEKYAQDGKVVVGNNSVAYVGIRK